MPWRPSGRVTVWDEDLERARDKAKRVVGLLKTGQQNPGSELHMADGTELWHDVEARAEDAAQPCAVTDLDGRYVALGPPPGEVAPGTIAPGRTETTIVVLVRIQFLRKCFNM